jgi:hypothetical protein
MGSKGVDWAGILEMSGADAKESGADIIDVGLAHEQWPFPSG